MQYSIDKLNDLRRELSNVTKEVQDGTLPPSEAADRITRIREEMDKIIQHLKDVVRK